MTLGSGPRCGAITQKGTPCQRPAVAGGPCVWHSRTRKPEPRKWPLPRRWQLMELMELLERGWDDARIGRELGCSADAVKLARRRYAIPPKSRTVLTAREVAKRLGISCAKAVSRWIEAGWLRGHRGWRQGEHRVWIVAETSLHAFLADPDHWHRWQPERIADPGLRQWAERQRGGVRFLSLSEARDRLCRERGICVETPTIHQWIVKGWLPAVRNGNHLIRETDLAAFTLPPLGRRKTAWDPCALCGDPDGPINPSGVTPARISGARYGVAGRVCRRCHRRLRWQYERDQAQEAA